MKFIPSIKGFVNPELNVDRFSGVYFLRLKGEIVYIGSSTNVRDRIVEHKCYKEFDEIAFIKMPPELMVDLEKQLIQILDPVGNKIKYIKKLA